MYLGQQNIRFMIIMISCNIRLWENHCDKFMISNRRKSERKDKIKEEIAVLKENDK
jgi:hypothetical protein